MFNILLYNTISAFEFNTYFAILLILLSGILTLSILAELTLIESGFTHPTYTLNTSMKNILDFSVATFSNRFIGLRVSEEVEIKGLKLSESPNQSFLSLDKKQYQITNINTIN